MTCILDFSKYEHDTIGLDLLSPTDEVHSDSLILTASIICLDISFAGLYVL